jgi:hypothetical protein
VAEAPLKSTYAEPTLMWRLVNVSDGRRGFSLIVPNGANATAGWFSQGLLHESYDFETWHDAMCWLDDKLATLQCHGWQVDDPYEQ